MIMSGPRRIMLMTWEDAGIGGNLPANSRTLRQLNYAGLAGAGANGLEGTLFLPTDVAGMR
jgi:hypothetical protein